MNCPAGVLSPMGTIYQHTFAAPGFYFYFCFAHCLSGMTGLVNVGCAQSGWSAGANLPSVGVRHVGVYFPANTKFYAMGGRASDLADSDFMHPFEYDPNTNTWTTKAATYNESPRQVNNMACGVLTESGTPYIYCIGGSAATLTTATARVFRYNPVTDTIQVLDSGDNWPGNNTGTILPGGFAVANNKLYILGGFNINVASTNQIWQFDPTAAIGSKWLQRVNTPVGIMYAPTASINGLILVGGASDYQGGLVIDTTNSFGFDPAINLIFSIPPIPRATGETRALTYNDGTGAKMLVMGGGRVAPNPSNEVNIYSVSTNSWTTGSPVPAFMTARRNFPTDSDGTTRIWLAGGYDHCHWRAAELDGNLLRRRRDAYTYSNSKSYSNASTYTHTYSDWDTHPDSASYTDAYSKWHTHTNSASYADTHSKWHTHPDAGSNRAASTQSRA